MKDLGITKGEWQVDKRASMRVMCNGITVASCSNSQGGENMETNQINAIFIADAGNTAQKCGLLPSELLKQRNELFKALKELTTLWNKVHTDKVLLGKPTLDTAKQTIVNIEKAL